MDVREKLVELLDEVQETGVNEIPAGFGCTREYVKNEMVASHLIANGVTGLPCKIGDEFWTDLVGITKVKCSMLTQKADGSWKGRFSIDNGWGSSVNVSLDEIGKTLFKTKEEAEANLPQPLKGE